jgi:hypothetical protein
MTKWKEPTMTLEQALALRLPGGKTLGEASPEELAAEAARIEATAEAIRTGKTSPGEADAEKTDRNLFAEAFRLIDEVIK